MCERIFYKIVIGVYKDVKFLKEGEDKLYQICEFSKTTLSLRLDLLLKNIKQQIECNIDSFKSATNHWKEKFNSSPDYIGRTIIKGFD